MHIYIYTDSVGSGTLLLGLSELGLCLERFVVKWTGLEEFGVIVDVPNAPGKESNDGGAINRAFG